jgi:hypothetical protein
VDWPGLDSGDRDLIVGDLKSLARRLESYLDAVLDAATAHLEVAGSAPDTAYGHWDAATQLASTARTAHASVTAQHVGFVHALQELVHRLYTTADVYDAHEQAIKQKIRQLDRLLQTGTATPRPATTPPNGPSW